MPIRLFQHGKILLTISIQKQSKIATYYNPYFFLIMHPYTVRPQRPKPLFTAKSASPNAKIPVGKVLSARV